MGAEKSIDTNTIKRVEMCGSILCKSDELRDINKQMSDVETIIKWLQNLDPTIYGQYSIKFTMPHNTYVAIPLTDGVIQPALICMQQVHANMESKQASALKDLFSAVQEVV